MAKEVIPKDGDPDYGDFLDSDDDDGVSRCEFTDWYDDGGRFCCTRLGEVLAGRYRIEHKLGWGAFSTVWLAHDIQNRKDVALKIILAGEDGEHDYGEYEYQMHEEILRTVRDTSHLVLHQGTFLHPSENNKHHRVLVLPFLCPSPGYRISELPYATRMSAAKQLLVALKGLHDVGLVHGDLNLGALMWKPTSTFDECDLATKYQRLGERPRRERFYNDRGKYFELVDSLEMSLDLYGSKLYLGDFGTTFKEGIQREFAFEGVPGYAPPEMYHGIDRTRASDMWSYMVLFVDLYLGTRIFWALGHGMRVSNWVDRLGSRMPTEWKGKFIDPEVVLDTYYDGGPPDIRTEYDETLADMIAVLRPDACQAERDLALSVMLKAFCFLPEGRITAGQLLEDPSFKALTDMY